jgi:tRNA threonylcarbamoyladenosine biosynthesis protein TsaB
MVVVVAKWRGCGPAGCYSRPAAWATMSSMANVLAVETSGTLCSLAIHADGRWFEDTQNVERLHNRVVLAVLDRLVDQAGVGRRDFEAVAFGAGPGSFTGIRIAASVAQGVAYAAGARVVPVPSSRALALAAGRPGRYGEVVTVTRSRRDAFYLARYRLGADALPERTQGDHLHQGDSAPADLGEGTPGVGDRPPWWPAGHEFLTDVAVTGRVVGELALTMLDAGEAVAPEAALPIYVSGDSPWRPAKR